MKSDLLNLTEEQRGIRDLAREFAQNEIAPFVAEWDEEARFDPSIVKKLGDLGFLGMLLPEQYQGLGVDTSTYLVALEEIAVVDASTAVLMSVHNSLPTQMILRFGSDEQKSRFLPGMATGDILGAFALSEPEAGSDAASLTTQAVRDGDCWILNGTKSWVTSGSYAGAILAMARTDQATERKGARGIGTFIVTPDLDGFHVGKKEDKLGLRGSPTVQLTFDNMR
ncbi:MAG: acyl-CoA dehydrogenase family protein, partial [Gemmatimonadaceae bacterium]